MAEPTRSYSVVVGGILIRPASSGDSTPVVPATFVCQIISDEYGSVNAIEILNDDGQPARYRPGSTRVLVHDRGMLTRETLQSITKGGPAHYRELKNEDETYTQIQPLVPLSDGEWLTVEYLPAP